MKLYNTLTRQLEEVKPLDNETFRVYTCGPTVYDHAHIGNLSSFIYADTLRRVLSHKWSVRHVMNFTDVDDKTIKRSQEDNNNSDAMNALLHFTDKYAQLFLEDMQSIGNDVTATKFVKATDSIAEMQNLITELYKEGIAYIAEDGVYFSIEKYIAGGKKYGQLTDVSASSTSESRIQNDEYDKDSAHDFAVWKKQKDNEPAWDFDLDGNDLKGRPGWHIECSAMSRAELGQPFDIHTGGVDLIFPHHENEIAQSTAGKQDDTYAKVFVHNEHLLVDGSKMSKSFNNFYTLDDIRAKGHNPLAFRVLILQSHYRKQAHFSWGNLQAAENRLKDLRAMASLRWQPVSTARQPDINNIKQQIIQSLEDDMNTPRTLAAISQFSSQIQGTLLDLKDVDEFNELLDTIDKLLGLGLSDIKDISDSQKRLIQDRNEARSNQDWTLSDKLRDEIAKQGIGLRDTDYGTIWYPL